MIKINIVAVGKVKENYFKDAASEYIKRLGRFCKLGVIEVKDENFADAKKCLAEQSLNILPHLKGRVYAMAIEGKQMDSEGFARLLGGDIGKGEEITFVIGSSYGLDDEVKKRADGLISFSEMTFPHTLARVMLLEQIYRAFTILSGTAYHK